MEVGKYYVISNIDVKYENCLETYGPFDTKEEAEKRKQELIKKATTFSYSFVSIVKVQK